MAITENVTVTSEGAKRVMDLEYIGSKPRALHANTADLTFTVLTGTSDSVHAKLQGQTALALQTGQEFLLCTSHIEMQSV